MSSSASARASVFLRHLSSSSSATPLSSLVLSPLPTSSSSSRPSGILAGEVAIITGSGQGIGAATAQLFAAEGAKVVVSDIDAAKSKAVADAIVAAGGDAISVPGDITHEKYADTIVQATVAKYGKINHIVNMAGFTFDGMLHKTTDQQWDIMLKVHQTAPFKLIRASSPYMRDAGKAEMDAGRKPENRCIINISSTSGLHGNVGQANYATAKAGVSGLTKTVAKEWGGFGVRCNTIAYGFIHTRLTSSKGGASMEVGGKKVELGIPNAEAAMKAASQMIPLKRVGQVEEAAGSVLMLCSPFASYITGHTLEVTGGAGI